jgi:hypothetical protein
MLRPANVVVDALDHPPFHAAKHGESCVDVSLPSVEAFKPVEKPREGETSGG